MIGYCGKEDFDWVTTLISLVAILVSVFALWIQIRQFTKQREPVVGLGMKQFDLELPRIDFDWEIQRKLDRKFSNTTLPIFNYGGTPALNITYSYKLTNKEAVRKKLEELLDEKKDFQLSLINNPDNVEDPDDIFVEVKGKMSYKVFGTMPYFRRSNMIKPGESIGIKLPSYFLVLINYLIRNNSSLNALPELELKITYNDTSYNKWETKFIIKIDRILKFTEKFTESGIYPYLECGIVHEYIGKNKIK